jgi:predicted pyridoxine 5'-phosphate oxidase superfamily flavin-nucleotide-binding protein
MVTHISIRNLIKSTNPKIRTGNRDDDDDERLILIPYSTYILTDRTMAMEGI